MNIKWETKSLSKFKDIKIGDCFYVDAPPGRAHERIVLLKLEDQKALVMDGHAEFWSFDDDDEVVKLKSTLIVEE